MIINLWLLSFFLILLSLLLIPEAWYDSLESFYLKIRSWSIRFDKHLYRKYGARAMNDLRYNIEEFYKKKGKKVDVEKVLQSLDADEVEKYKIDYIKRIFKRFDPENLKEES